MSALKMFIGFLVGIVACAILIGLISIRSPILASDAANSTEGSRILAANSEETQEQSVNIYADSDPEDLKEEEIQASTEEAMEASDEPLELDVNLENENQEELANVELEAQKIVDDVAAAEIDESNDQIETSEDGETKKKFSLPVVGGDSSGNTIKVGTSQSSRLPTVGQEDITSETQTDEEFAPQESTEAFIQNASIFLPDGRPSLTIIMEDVGVLGVDPVEVSDLNAPITMALGTNTNNMRQRVQDYQQIGLEMVAVLSSTDIASLRENLSDDMARLLVQDQMSLVPSAVAIVDSPSGALQKDRQLMSSILNAVSEPGLGLLTYSKGLNSADKSAKEAGVRFGKISRVLDENNEDIATIERALNRATLEAKQSGGVIVFCMNTSSTLLAISSWLSTPRSKDVQITPLTATILKLGN